MRREIVSRLRKEYIASILAKGERMDGRRLDESRSINIQFNVTGSAEGSARVQIGKTDVIVGVKMGVGTPYPDSPESGVLSTNAELSPIAAPNFETGPPREDAIELARVTDRAIRESGAVDFDSLCITPGEEVWMLFIDIQPVDYDGNLFDAAEIGALAALMSAKIPYSRMEEGAEDKPLPVRCFPVSITAAKIGDSIVFDPNLDEEHLADARLTVGVDENGAVRAMQKGLSGGFTREEVGKIIRTAGVLGDERRRLLFEAAEEAGVPVPR
ncbi:MAG: exosome complex protein Rrp42 [Thermoplasmata archaeon]|nr:exosome complex protein Rrp42 [Thermoplasmata archaeon]